MSSRLRSVGFRLLTGAVALAAIALIASFWTAPTSTDWLWALLLAAAILAFAVASDQGEGGVASHYPAVMGIAMLPPSLAALLMATTMLERGRSPSRVLFNSSMMALMALAAAVVLRGCSARSGHPAIGMLAALPAAMVYVGLNMTLVLTATWVQTGNAPSGLLRESLSSSRTAMVITLSGLFIGITSGSVPTTSGIALVASTLVLLWIALADFGRYVRLVGTYPDALRSLLAASEGRDPYARGHSKRVAALGRAIAAEMDLSNQQVSDVELAGLMHDIGMLRTAWPPDAHEHPPRQDDHARGIELPNVSAELVETIPALAHLAPVVRSHHENYDGSGYPRGLSGDELPIEARILKVADTFDALTSQRPHCTALTSDQAMDEIAREAGVQLDPKVASAALRLLLRQDSDAIDTVR